MHKQKAVMIECKKHNNKFMKQKNVFIVVSIAAIMIIGSCMNNKVQKANLAIDPANMDTTINPGEDFYHYTNGGWIAANPIGDEYSQYGVFRELYEKNQQQLNDLIKEVSKRKEVEKGSAAQKIRDFYNSGMDTIKIDKLGYEPIKPLLDKIEVLESINDVQNFIAQQHAVGQSVLFSFFGSTDPGNSEMIISTLNQSGLGLPDVEYYTSDDPRSKEIREKYVEHIEKMLTITGTPQEQAKKDAQTILDLETRLAKASMTRLERRDPNKTFNKMTFEEVKEQTPNLNWDAFFTTIGLQDPGDINVRMPDFYAEVNKLMIDIPVNDWRKYLKWHTVNNNANYLSPEIEKADFDFYQAFLSGVKQMRPRWKRVMSTTSGYLGEPFGKLYVEKHFPPEAKERMVKLVNNLKYSLGERIKALDWMTDSTKQKALEKLDVMTVKIGYPDPGDWVDFTPFEVVEGEYLTNINNGRKFYKHRNLDKIGKPVNRDEWVMSPQTVNAGYIPSYNQIVFPAGILQPPFFFLDADDAVNYGSIGVVIGHEMTHGFDDKGRLYDRDGNLTNWWTEEDSENFEKKSETFVTQFDNFVVLDSLHVNGELTLGENIADNGGLNVSWDAFQKAMKGKEQEKIMGFTPKQRFFLAYAQLWRQTIRDEELTRRLQEDVHSPGTARVNAALVNIPHFYEAFDIQANDKLYVAENERAKVW